MKLVNVLSVFIGIFVLACSSAAPDSVEPTKHSTSDFESDKANLPTDRIKTPTASGRTNGLVQKSFQPDEAEFGTGGLVSDLGSSSDVSLPQFVIASHIDIDQLANVSKFRSSAGHDFSDSFEDCCSMKHYFHPADYYGTRFSQPIYSPVNGIVLYVTDGSGGSGSDDWKVAYKQATGLSAPADYLDWDIFIRPDDAPNVWIRHMHVNPIDEIVDAIPKTSSRNMMQATARPAEPGFRVKAGDLIGHGLGEISVTKHLDGTGIPTPCNSSTVRKKWAKLPGCQEKISHHSIFELMTDEVFAEYQKLASVSRSDFMITAPQRAAAQLVCDGEYFLNTGNVDDPDVYVRLQESLVIIGEPQKASQEASRESNSQSARQTLPGFSALAANREIIKSFNANGTHTLSTVNATEAFVIVIAADGGPVSISDDLGSVKRKLYAREKQDGVSVYETPVGKPGRVKLTVDADEDVKWEIVVVKAD